MRVENLIRRTYDFEGNAEEWLAFEEEVNEIVKTFSNEENSELEESDAMESLLMVCDGIIQ